MENFATTYATESDKPHKPSVQVIGRVLTVLQILADHPSSLSLQEIAQKAKLPPSTAFRILTDLSSQGFTEKTPQARWNLGLAFLQYASLVRDRILVRERALPIMQVLFQHSGLTVNLSLRRDDQMIYVEHIYSPEGGIRLSRQVGASAPLHCSSGGKLFLCSMRPEEVSAYITRTHLTPRTTFSIQTPEKLILELNRVKDLGWAEDNQELEYGVYCIGAGIYDARGKMCAALTMISDDKMQDKVSRVKELKSAASAISAAMGYLPA